MKILPFEQAYLPREIDLLLGNWNLANSRNGILKLYIIKDITIIVIMNRLKYISNPQLTRDN